jgi:hypothetical protein
MSETHTIQLSQATFQELMEAAKRRGLTPEEWIRSYLPTQEDTVSGETLGERLTRKGLIGLIDSSQPDPASLPQFGRSPSGLLIIEPDPLASGNTPYTAQPLPPLCNAEPFPSPSLPSPCVVDSPQGIPQ